MLFAAAIGEEVLPALGIQNVPPCRLLVERVAGAPTSLCRRISGRPELRRWLLVKKTSQRTDGIKLLGTDVDDRVESTPQAFPSLPWGALFPKLGRRLRTRPRPLSRSVAATWACPHPRCARRPMPAASMSDRRSGRASAGPPTGKILIAIADLLDQIGETEFLS